MRLNLAWRCPALAAVAAMIAACTTATPASSPGPDLLQIISENRAYVDGLDPRGQALALACQESIRRAVSGTVFVVGNGSALQRTTVLTNDYLYQNRRIRFAYWRVLGRDLALTSTDCIVSEDLIKLFAFAI
jgi:hypothetical protein